MKRRAIVSRRNWMITSSACVLSGVAIKRVEQAGLADDALIHLEGVIDSHVHFYDPEIRGGLVWPERDSTLYRQVLPKHLMDQKTYSPILGVIIVEASPIIWHNDWLLELSAGDRLIKGVVGSLTPVIRFLAHLETYRQNQLFRGIRIQSTTLLELLDKESLEDLRLLADAKLSLDILGGPDTLPAIAKLAQAIPSLTIVVDHLGNVPVTSHSPPKDWVEGMKNLARFTNVYCKVSGMMENARRRQEPATTEPGFYRPYIDVAWESFGEDRLMFGSNWPVCEIAGDYQAVQRIALDYISEKGPVATKKFAASNTWVLIDLHSSMMALSTASPGFSSLHVGIPCTVTRARLLSALGSLLYETYL